MFVFQADALGGQGEQGRAAAGQQKDHPIGLAQVADQLQHAARHALAGVIRHRMGGFDHFDFFAVGAVLVTGNHQAGDFALPFLLNHFGHGRGGFAGAYDDDATATIFRQVISQNLARVGGVDGAGEQLAQQGRWIE